MKSPNSKVRCQVCSFYDPRNSFEGFCCRKSPAPDAEERGVFPIVYATSWCGDFQKQENTRKDPAGSRK